jgi:hypothetical protein
MTMKLEEALAVGKAEANLVEDPDDLARLDYLNMEIDEIIVKLKEPVFTITAPLAMFSVPVGLDRGADVRVARHPLTLEPRPVGPLPQPRESHRDREHVGRARGAVRDDVGAGHDDAPHLRPRGGTWDDAVPRLPHVARRLRGERARTDPRAQALRGVLARLVAQPIGRVAVHELRGVLGPVRPDVGPVAAHDGAVRGTCEDFVGRPDHERRAHQCRP